MLNTISGSITGFMNCPVPGEEENTWAVNLMGDHRPTAGTVTSSRRGHRRWRPWSLERYAMARSRKTIPIRLTWTRQLPLVRVGEFNANFGNGSVAGAFGAREE